MRENTISLRAVSKRLAKGVLIKSRAMRAAARFAPPAAAILMYHSIAEDPLQTAQTIGISQPLAGFEAHIRTLAEQFNPVTVAQVEQFARERQPLPPRSVAVTFDDGFLDNYEIALPILNHYGVPATFYILVGAVDTGGWPWYCRIRHAFSTTSTAHWVGPHGRKHELVSAQDRMSASQIAWDCGAKKAGQEQEDFVSRLEKSLEIDPLSRSKNLMMTWDQIRAVRRAGHIIGAHTCTHPNLAFVSEVVAESEIVESKTRIEGVLGEPVEHFSYPHPALNPQWNQTTLEITRKAGFGSAALTRPGPVRQGDDALLFNRLYASNDLRDWLWNLDRTFLGQRV